MTIAQGFALAGMIFVIMCVLTNFGLKLCDRNNRLKGISLMLSLPVFLTAYAVFTMSQLNASLMAVLMGVMWYGSLLIAVNHVKD